MNTIIESVIEVVHLSGEALGAGVIQWLPLSLYFAFREHPGL
jgi:hypothetical protein